ncbi:hypothetical protein [Candidatus Korobacter versatilis]|uniref:hypothetical protein n=1 Tax=Candidatus Korobacter versatilis TaxID=658062 RepID=UPI0011D0A177|nr:hypothetical protein [Candidatus Koribacter versatilis]
MKRQIRIGAECFDLGDLVRSTTDGAAWIGVIVWICGRWFTVRKLQGSRLADGLNCKLLPGN